MMKLFPDFVTDPRSNPVLFTAAVGFAVGGFFFLWYMNSGSKGAGSNPPLSPQGTEGFIARAVIEMDAEHGGSGGAAAAEAAKPKGLFRKKASSSSKHNGPGSSRICFSREIVQKYFADMLESSTKPKLIADTPNLNVLREAMVRIATEYDASIEGQRTTAFDDENPKHVALLETLWRLGVDAETPMERTSERWDKLGFQGTDPKTDLRGGGVLSLCVFVDFVQKNTQLVKTMQEHIAAQHAAGTMNWLLIACASINITVSILLPQQQGHKWPTQFLCSVYRGALFVEAPPPVADTTSDSGVNHVSKFSEEVAGGVDSGATKLVRNEEWRLFDSLCRVHHSLFKLMWSEFSSNNVSVMEFEPFLKDKVLSKLRDASGDAIVV